MDGGIITVLNLAIWTNDGFIVENSGVPPDIEVEMLPSEYQRKRSPAGESN